MRVATYLLLLMLGLSANVQASEETQENTQTEDKLELTTTYIKGNKELPQTLYIVPWQSIKKKKTTPENMVLHSLYGDIFQPVIKQDIE
ncbi:hypothetical protein CW745_01105 [Psychromonas sp. psych-6C06]|uniref:hypothetical protein n=1 Tax=Psychromonas sp. psych-6C06 TaxID=2058089 RepID=UPI000C33C8C2|nr:hypothetical protein [Psychromonas sp. psych-6C06]PKF63477.1 hypothetical protein CW745_01105 [Psychromonas sp. psych-6C06]